MSAFSKPSNVTLRSSASSNSDSDNYGNSRRRATAKSHRRRNNQSSSDSAPSHGELRFSTRRAAKVSNYNEDDGESFDEEDPDTVGDSYWAIEADDSPAIDEVLNHKIIDRSSKCKPYTSF